jgi:serine/threonine-protein kinase
MTDPTWKNDSPHRPSPARELERLWEQGQQPDPFAFLEAAGPCPPTTAAAVLAVDQWQRWHAGQRVPAEEYLRRCPGLIGDADAALEVIYGEFLVRRALGEAVGAAEYLTRFPQYAAGLREQFALFAAMDTGNTSGATAFPSRPPTCPAGAGPTAAGGLPELPGYQVVGELGRGGMGLVYRAFEPRLGRSLAVKVLLPEHRDNPGLRRRFLEEAQVMGQLQHPGVAPVHELGELPDGRPFFTMKQVMGQTLAELLPAPQGVSAAPARGQAGGLPAAARLLAVFAQVCQTMAYAHSRGILHRDLKPANVMVGAFGEVQVMDWGLAKVLTGAGAAPRPSAPPGPPLSTVCTVRTAQPESEQTEAGTVLGTPAYMPPEQARGEVELLDEHADVFGLGGILCAVLTGWPPFPGTSQLDSHRRAIKGDLAETLARLDGCGADAELVSLAKRCLAAEPAGRPRHAGEVAEAVATYQAGVQERLRRAEIDRAAAQVKAAEERKRRRVSRALAVVAAAFVLAGAAVGLGYAQQRAARAERRQLLEADLGQQLDALEQQRGQLHRRLADPLEAARLLGDPGGWQGRVERLRAAWQRAATVYEGGRDVLEASWSQRLDGLDRQLRADEVDWEWARRLDRIRQDASITVEGFNSGRVFREYPQAFAALRLDVARGAPDRVAGRVRRAPLRYALVAALDYWAGILPRGREALRRRLLRIARLADPDPLRTRLRDAVARRNPHALKALAARRRSATWSAQNESLLAHALLGVGNVSAAVPVLRRAVGRHPSDFWLNYDLAHFMHLQKPTDYSEVIRFYTAALALRRHSPGVHLNLGLALTKHGRLDEAMAVLRRAIRLKKDYAEAYNNLGIALFAKGRLNRAIAKFRTAIRLRKDLVPAHDNLGLALEQKKDWDGAIAAFRRAARLDRAHYQAHYNLGRVLLLRGRLDEAIAALRRAVLLKKNFAPAHNNLGLALARKGRLDQAIAAYRRAIHYQPDNPEAYINLGAALHRQDRLDQAVAAFQKAIRLRENFPQAHYNLGLSLARKKDLDGAITAFRKAIHYDKNFAESYLHLGDALERKGRLDDARIALRKAIRLRENFPEAHLELGLVLAARGDLGGAAAAFRKAIHFKRDYTVAHYNLGNVLWRKGRLHGAVASYRRAIRLAPEYAKAHCNMGLVLQRQGKFTAALDALERGHALGSKDPHWPYPSAKWVRHCRYLRDLDCKLPAVLRGEVKPPAREQLAFAFLCLQYKGLYAAAARLSREALTARPQLGEDYRNGYRFSAARAAALAACGRGKDAAGLKEEERAGWRKQALAWLRADLASWSKFLKEHTPQTRARVQQTLRQWQDTSDLAGLRDPKALAKLPAAERQDWHQFWDDVAALLPKAPHPK